MNLIEKIHVLLISDAISIWHYVSKPDKKFSYFLTANPDEVFYFDTLEEMVIAAYSRIDPLLKPLTEI